MDKADITINLDANCSICGAKGATQAGICLECVTKRITKGGIMAVIEARVQTSKLEAKVKLVEEKEEGRVIDRHLITEVKLEYEGTPAQLDKVLYALRSGQQIDVIFGSPQFSLDESQEEKEPAFAG